MTRSAYQLCIDRVVPIQHKARAAELAIKANPKNKPVLPSRLLPGVSANPAKISFFVGKQWPKGKTLKVAFLDGTATQRKKAQHMAAEWSEYGDVHFKFNAGASAEVRISFNFQPGASWSAIGTDCLSTEAFPKDQPTMNFGWLDDDTDDTEWRRVVVHEFGHAIGAVHEHQVPKGGIKWNLPKVYAYFSGPPNNWSKEEIDVNIVQKYSVSQLNGTSFDRASIMLYQFPGEFILSPASLRKTGTALNTDLSKSDKKFVATMYGKP